METERAELVEIEAAVSACNDVAVSDHIRIALVRDLKPIAENLAEYALAASRVVVNDQPSAEQANQLCIAMAADIATVKGHEVLGRITDGLHKLHRRWTGLRDMFCAPLEANRRVVKSAIIQWQEAERLKAEALQRKLQAEADAKAERERQALLKKAEAVKTPELKESYREQAAQVATPTVAVEAPKSDLRISHRWRVQAIQLDAFFNALAHDASLRGYVKIEETKMERSKAINPNL